MPPLASLFSLFSPCDEFSDTVRQVYRLLIMHASRPPLPPISVWHINLLFTKRLYAGPLLTPLLTTELQRFNTFLCGPAIAIQKAFFAELQIEKCFQVLPSRSNGAR